jgi:hypothetical protein
MGVYHGYGILCRCPVRVYIAKNMHKFERVDT